MFVPLRTRVGANTGTPSLIGHLRSGESTSVNGKRRPVASDTWIVSGVDQRVADAVSDHFGAPVEPWDDPKTMDKWRVRTGLPTVPVRLGYLDPDRLAHYELFGGKGLVKRCDATRDGTRTCWTVLRDGPHTAEVSGPCECVAAIETGRQGDECRPTLRLPVFLDIPGLPVAAQFGFVSHSEIACMEIPWTIAGAQQALGENLFRYRMELAIVPRSSSGGSKVYHVPVLRIREAVETLVAIQSGRSDAELPGPPPRPELASPVEYVADDTREWWRTTIRGMTPEQKSWLSEQFQTHGIDLRNPVPVAQTETVAKLMDDAMSDIDDAEVVE